VKRLVSSDPFSVLALVAALSVLQVAIFIPHGFAWMGLGWVGLALSAALWASVSSSRSIAQVVHGVAVEPMPAAAAKSRRLAARIRGGPVGLID